MFVCKIFFQQLIFRHVIEQILLPIWKFLSLDFILYISPFSTKTNTIYLPWCENVACVSIYIYTFFKYFLKVLCGETSRINVNLIIYLYYGTMYLRIWDKKFFFRLTLFHVYHSDHSNVLMNSYKPIIMMIFL